MAILINRWHRGFNRLWLVFSCLLAFAFVGINWLGREYTVYRYGNVTYQRVKTNYDFNESTIKHRVSKRWHEWVVNKENNPPRKTQRNSNAAGGLSNEKIERILDEYFGEDYSVKGRIFRDVESMKEAKSFTKLQLNAIVENTMTYEKKLEEAKKTYPIRWLKARGRFVRDLLGSFTVTFAFGHGVFCLIIWIVRGFR